MNVEELVQYWQTTAADSERVMRHLFEKGDYPEALFFGHLYIEKLLKALVVKRTETQAPPSHQLGVLATKAGLDSSREQDAMLDELTGFNLRARYPDFRFAFKKLCDKNFCASKMVMISELARWLKNEIES